MCNEYYDEIHYENQTSLIILRRDELKWFWKQLSNYAFCIAHMQSLCLCHVYINNVWCVYDSWGMLTCCFGIITLWLRLSVFDKLSMCWIVRYTCVLRCCVHWVVSYEPYNHTTVRPFKGDQLMRDEYCDGIHFRNPTSLTVWGAMS